MKNSIGYADLAARLGVKINAVYTWVAEGRVPHVRFGNRAVRFETDLVEAWVAQHRIGEHLSSTVVAANFVDPSEEG